MDQASLSKAANYPFSSEAKSLAKEKAYSLESIPGEVIETAEKLLTETVKGKEYPSLQNTRHSQVLESHALAFTVSKILLALINEPSTAKRFAESYSVSLLKSFEREEFEELELLAQDLGIRLYWEEPPYAASMKVLDYIGVDFSRESQEIVNQHVKNGRVFLSREELTQFLSRKAYTLFYDSIQEMQEQVKDIPNNLKKAAKELKKELDKALTQFKGLSSFKGRNLNAFPPCITILYSSLSQGKQLSHLGNFALATFLASLKYSEQEMLALYKKSPNYNEAIASYQIKRIIGSGPEPAYAAPSCEKMKEYGLCSNKDYLCEKVNHPLSYYKIRAAAKAKERKAQEEERKAQEEEKKGLEEKSGGEAIK